ncbi:MAG: type I DNA topoisomerase [Gammaproteobacteria bacterium]|nr:type I DNA topoisomerase [Gammaproteobacteria bacterium]
MGKSLVIVESPAKAKTINKYLGSDFIVKSSVGHIRDLPTGSGSESTVDPKARAKAAAETRKLSPAEKEIHKKKKERLGLVTRMGVDPDHGWKARYEILPGKEKVVRELKEAAAKADAIYLATDLDREGEAIAWHLRETIGGDDSRYQRVTFNEITKKAIQEAFSKPAALNMNRVNAQQARRFLDRVVGYMVSPLLWKKVARGLSAGRVQSVAVRLIVEREREIRAFLPEEYWDLHADTRTAKAEALRLEVAKLQGKAFRPESEAQTQAAVIALKDERLTVASREDKPAVSRASPPFITSTLQQAASSRLGFSVKKTMTLAQRLYEAGYITYMRTDSTNLSMDAILACRDFVGAKYGPRYVPEKPNFYASKEGAQEAHEAIRPSNVATPSTALAGMEKDAERLYDLIWRQFVACQMTPAEYDASTIEVKAGAFELRAKGRVLRFDGWTKVLPPQKKGDDDLVLPDVKPGEILSLLKLDPKQHFTKAPARFTEAALVKELEKRGIGRPSTYAAIISTIQERGYVRLEARRFYAEKMGEIVTTRLMENFHNLMDYDFTKSMEEALDAVAQGQQDWTHELDKFYGDFSEKLAKAEQDSSQGGMRVIAPVILEDFPCPTCGRAMAIRTGPTGVFLGCTGYSLPPAERCTQTMNLVGADDLLVDGDDDEAESRVLRAKHRCTLCGSAMSAYLVDASRKLHICGNGPECSGHELERGTYRIKGYEGPSIECDKCGGEMQLKTGRFGKYFGCMDKACGNTRKLLKSGEVAPPKSEPIPMPGLRCLKVDDFYVLRDGAAGLFLAASGFPKNRETRAPLLSEILPVKDRLDPKFHFLLAGPIADPEGNPTVVRFSRKSKQQYLASEKDGKATGWAVVYADGQWKPLGDGGDDKPGRKPKKAATA